MSLLDVRTLLVVQMAMHLVCMLVVVLLWWQNRARFAGLSLWVADFVLLVIAPALIALRGRIPDWASVTLASPLVVIGLLLLYIGLQRFLKSPGGQLHNWLLVVPYAGAHAYFTHVQPNLSARNLLLSSALLLLSAQCAWLLMRRTEPALRRAALGAGAVFAALCVVNAVRIGLLLSRTNATNDFFRSGTSDILMLLSYLMLSTMLTFSLVLLVNGRLIAEVRAGEEKFAKAFRSSPCAILLTRLGDGRILEANDSFLKISGYGTAEVLGKTTGELGLWDRDEDRAGVVATLANRGRIRESEFCFRRRSGEPATGLLSAEVVTIDGEPCVLSSVNDITERTAFERKLAEKSAEMERFAYSVSHDLKSPLITVTTYLGYLEQDVERRDAARVGEDLQFMRTAAQRMERMLRELLEFSRLGRIQSAAERVAWSDLVNEALGLVAGRIAERHVAVRVVGPATMLSGDRARLVEVWQNLIDNAVKFMGSQPAPAIEIGAEAHDGGTEFYVRDNGIGVEPRFGDRIFDLFEKLDRASEGTGIGLALVKRIVELHGGRIWLETPGPAAGACFRFTLPSAPVA